MQHITELARGEGKVEGAHDECVRLLAENELLRAALLAAHEEEGVCFCHVLDNQRCLVRLNDGTKP